MSAQSGPKLAVLSLGDQMQVELSQDRAEGVRILHGPIAPVAVKGDAVGETVLSSWQYGGEYASIMHPFQGRDRLSVAVRQLGFVRPGVEGRKPQTALGLVQAKPVKGVVKPSLYDRLCDMRRQYRCVPWPGLSFAPSWNQPSPSKSWRTLRTGIGNQVGRFDAS